jgi:predicted transcriptional regulator
VNNPNLCGRKEYDFYLNNYNIVTEAHGIQHYEESNRGRSLKDEQENDRIKKELALQNNIEKEKYIVIDCRYSDLDWIKNSILDSYLNELFDLSKVDWLKAEEFALSNRVKEACKLWNNNPSLSVTEIAKLMNLDRQIVRKYLKKGKEHNWCDYNAELESNKSIDKFVDRNLVSIVCIDTKAIFKSIKQCADKSLELFKVKLLDTGICRACKSHKKYKGFMFKYIYELTKDELKEYIEVN